MYTYIYIYIYIDVISFHTLVAAVFTESQVCPSTEGSPRPQHNGVGVKHLDVFPGKQMNDNRIPRLVWFMHGCFVFYPQKMMDWKTRNDPKSVVLSGTIHFPKWWDIFLKMRHLEDFNVKTHHSESHSQLFSDWHFPITRILPLTQVNLATTICGPVPLNCELPWCPAGRQQCFKR